MRRKCAFFIDKVIQSDLRYEFNGIDASVTIMINAGGVEGKKRFKNIQVEISYEEAKEE